MYDNTITNVNYIAYQVFGRNQTGSICSIKIFMEKIVQLCARRGFIFQRSKVYGGLRGSYDYGPLGVQMKKNLSDLWWRDFIERRTDCVGLDSSIISHPGVWETSGHVDEFTDPLTECSKCKQRVRADHLLKPSSLHRM